MLHTDDSSIESEDPDEEIVPEDTNQQEASHVASDVSISIQEESTDNSEVNSELAGAHQSIPSIEFTSQQVVGLTVSLSVTTLSNTSGQPEMQHCLLTRNGCSAKTFGDSPNLVCIKCITMCM